MKAAAHFRRTSLFASSPRLKEFYLSVEHDRDGQSLLSHPPTPWDSESRSAIDDGEIASVEHQQLHVGGTVFRLEASIWDQLALVSTLTCLPAFARFCTLWCIHIFRVSTYDCALLYVVSPRPRNFAVHRIAVGRDHQGIPLPF